MKKRVAISAIVGLAAISLLGACSADGGTEGDDGGAPEGAAATGPITVWFSNNEQEVAWGNDVTERWNAEHPDETISAQEIPAGSSSEEAITAAITAGTAPCLVYNISPAAAPQWERQGGLVDLTTLEGGEDYLAERGGELIEGYRGQDGGLFQMPWKSNPVMVMYNKEIFTEAGIDPENPDMDTYEKFTAAAQEIVDSGAANAAIWPAPTSEFYQSWFDFYPTYLAQTGGTNFVEDNEATFNDENGAAVMEFWKGLYDKGLAPKEASTDDAMGTGAAAMQVAGPWAIASYEGNIDYGFMPVPTQDGVAPEESYTFADAKNISMFTSCENTGTAWEFLKFTTSEESDGALLEATGQMPMRQDLTETYADYFDANPNYVTFADQAGRTVDVPNVPNSVEAWQDFRDDYSAAVIFDSTPIADALAEAETSVNDLISQ